ncbi:MAG: DUF790 family protein [Zetaproteobacteria bacterium]|nr:DUF790 family protein [Zetaproteobacteria bacterium]
MLTKDLLKYKKRKGVLYPETLDPSCSHTHAAVSGFVDTLKRCQGHSQEEVLHLLDESAAGEQIHWSGLRKIALDKIKWSNPDPEYYQQRIQTVLAAQKLRCEQLLNSLHAYQELFAAERSQSYATISTELYQDLPQNCQALEVPQMSVEAWILLYNFSQVQSLLLRAEKGNIQFEKMSTSEARRFIRVLKFHRLLAEWGAGDTSESLHAEITGPNAITGSAQSYGLQFAKLLTALKSFTHWEAVFTLKLTPKGTPLQLQLSDKSPIGKTTPSFTQHLPEEHLNALADQKGNLPTFQSCETVLTLSGEKTAVPDFKCQAETPHPTYVEIFHRWHRSQLCERLTDLEKSSQHYPFRLLLGVDRSILSHPETRQALEKSAYFQAYGFLFRDFPSTKIIQNSLHKALQSDVPQDPE